jgi:hypothetical protein
MREYEVYEYHWIGDTVRSGANRAVVHADRLHT